MRTLKSVLITGSNRGIGFGLAERYAKLGRIVYACCRDPAHAADLKELSAQFERVEILRLDVTNPNHIEDIQKKLSGKPLDLLINNAGTIGDSETIVGKMSVMNLHNLFSTNTIAPLKISEALLPNLDLGSEKTIVAISSTMASIAENISGKSLPYRGSKTALNSIMRSLSINLRDKGIKVLMLDPGWVKTDMGGERAPVSVDESVNGLIEQISQSDASHSGEFYRYDGSRIKW